MKSFLSLIVALFSVVASVHAFMPASSSSIQRTAPLEMTVLTYNGKKKDFRAGSPMKNAASGLGIKPRYSCRKGDCNSHWKTLGDRNDGDDERKSEVLNELLGLLKNQMIDPEIKA